MAYPWSDPPRSTAFRISRSSVPWSRSFECLGIASYVWLADVGGVKELPDGRLFQSALSRPPSLDVHEDGRPAHVLGGGFPANRPASQSGISHAAWTFMSM